MPSWSDILLENRKAALNQAPLSLTGMNFDRSVKTPKVLNTVPKTPTFIKPPSHEENRNKALDAAYKKGGWEGFQASVAKAADTPVIKQLIDALSVGTYATANVSEDILTGIDKVGRGDMGGITDILASPFTGLGKGLSAAAGNDNDVKTYSDVIKHGQKMAGFDTENDAAKWVQGVGGFIGDVALDPTTYLSLGGTALVKGAVRGAVEGGSKATRKATEGIAKGATDADKKVIGLSQQGRRSLEDIANQPYGIGNRLSEVGKETKFELDKYKAANGGKIVKFGLPFGHTKAARVEDGASINSVINPQQEMRNFQGTPLSMVNKALQHPADQMLEKLNIPHENLLDEVKTPAKDTSITDLGLIPSEVTPLPKLPEIKLSDEVKAVNKELSDNEKAVGRLKNLMDNYEFNVPAYSDAAGIAKVFEDAKPRMVEKEVPAPSPSVADEAAGAPSQPLPAGANKKRMPAAGPTVSIKPAEVLADINSHVRQLATKGEATFFKWSTGQKSPKEIVAIIENALASGSTAAANMVLKNLDPSLTRPFIEKARGVVDAVPVGKVKKAEPTPVQMQKIQEEMPGIPITPEMLTKLGIKPEHHGITSAEELAGLMRKATSKTDVLAAIRQLPTEEIAKIAELIGHPKFTKDQVIKFLRDTPNLFQNYQKGIKTIEAEARKISKKELDYHRNVAGIREMSGSEYDSLRKITQENPEFVRTRQLNNAIAAEDALKDGIVKADGESTITGRDLKNISDEALASFIAHQGNPKLQLQTKRKFITDTPTKKDGNVSHPGLAPTFSAIQPYQKIVSELRKFAPKATIPERLQATLKISQAVDTKMRTLGFNPTLNLARKPGERTTINLSFYDVIDSLHSIKDGDQIIIKNFIGSSKDGIDITTGMSAIEGLIRGSYAGLSPKQIEDNVYAILAGYASAYPHYKKTAELVKAYIQKTVVPGRVAGGMSVKDATNSYLRDMRRLASKLVYDPNLLHTLNDRMKLNALQHGVNVRMPIAQATDAQQELIRTMAVDPAKTAGDYINQIMVEAKKDIVGNSPLEARNLANKAFDDLKAGVLTVPEESAITLGIKVREARTRAEVNAANAARSADPKLTEEARQVLENDPDVPTVMNPKTKVEEPAEWDLINAKVAMDTWHRIHPAKSFFEPRFGLSANTFRDINTGNHTVANMRNSFHNNVLKYLEKNKATAMDDYTDVIKMMLESRKSGQPPMVGALTPSSQELFAAFGTVVDPSDMNVFATSGIGSAHFNAIAEKKGFTERYKVILDETKTPAENIGAWVDAEGIKNADDVFDYMDRYDAILTHAASEISIAGSFMEHFASKTMKPGYVKLKWDKRSKDDYGFFDLLDKERFYSTEGAYQVTQVHKMLKETRSISNETSIGRFMNNVFDPITNFLKATQTTIRPGHWVMSVEGDLMRNFLLVGITSVKPYKHSIGIMKAMHHDMSMFGTNPIEALKYARRNAFGGYEVTTAAKASDNVAINIGGKVQNVSYQSLGRMLQGTATIPGYKGGVLEDFLMTDSTVGRFAQSVNNTMDSVLSNKKFNANRLAAQRDNFSRIAIAIDHASKTKFKNLEDLKRGMEDEVIKWAPTSTDFTARESKYARRSMLYYTWLRGITPRVMDNLLTKPGTALSANKALYNFAVTQGVDPISIGNPFPVDGMFPSYYYNNIIGPQWQDRDSKGGMWGINPSSPVIEVLNSFGRGITPNNIMNPLATDGAAIKEGANLLGMATPFVKAPLEMATGQSSGVPIRDNAQYLQDTLGGSWVSTASKASGKLLNGQGRTDSANRMDPNSQNEQAITQLVNFLSGGKLTDYQSDSALRSYMGEQNQKRQNQRLNLKREI